MEPQRLIRFLGKVRLGWLVTLPLIPDFDILWTLPCIIAAGPIIRRHGIRAVWTTSTPFSSLVTGFVLSKRFKIPWIADLRDPWMSNPYWQESLSGLRGKIYRRLECYLLAHADTIVVVTSHMRRDLIDRVNVPSGKIRLLRNGFFERDFPRQGQTQPVTKPDTTRPLRIAHIGLFYADASRPPPVKDFDSLPRSPFHILQATRKLIDNGGIADRAIEFRFVGPATPGNRAFVEQLGLSKMVHHVGPVPHARALEEMRNADVLFVPLSFPHSDRYRDATSPSKLYESMASHKPILAVMPEGEAKEMLRKAGTAVFVDPYKPYDMERALLHFLKCHTEGASSVGSVDTRWIEKFGFAHLAPQLADIIRTCCGNRAS